MSAAGTESLSQRPVAADRTDGADASLRARVERWAGLVPYGIVAYFLVQALLRIAISGNLEIDEAEIARHGVYALGYGNSNPPLYDWVVVSLWKVTGSWPAALALAKNGLLAAAYLLFFRCGRLLFGTRTGAATLALSLLLMPQIVWQAQITLSHSTAAAAACAALIAALAWLLDRQTTIRFAALGLALAATLLSKYSALLLVIALVCAVLMVPGARKRLGEPRLLLSAAIAVLLAAPHYVWVLHNIETSTARLAKLTVRNPLWSRLDLPGLGIDGLLTSVQALAVSAGPLLIVWAAARWLARREPDDAAPAALGTLYATLAGRGLIAGLAILGIAVLATDTHHVSDRYLAQFLMLLPVWLSLAYPLAFRPRAMRRFLATSLGLAAAVTLVWPQLALFGNHRFAYPYDAVAAEVVKAAGPDAAILMERGDYATNIALRMPGGRFFDAASPARTVAALWDADEDRQATLTGIAGPCYRLDGPVRRIAAPFHYFSGNEARLALAVLRFDPAAGCAAPASDQP